jgi:hypothetical protein
MRHFLRTKLLRTPPPPNAFVCSSWALIQLLFYFKLSNNKIKIQKNLSISSTIVINLNYTEQANSYLAVNTFLIGSRTNQFMLFFLTVLYVPDEIILMLILIHTLDTRWNSCIFSCKISFILPGMKQNLNVSTNIIKQSLDIKFHN